jgi:hypothetical protein
MLWEVYVNICAYSTDESVIIAIFHIKKFRDLALNDIDNIAVSLASAVVGLWNVGQHQTHFTHTELGNKWKQVERGLMDHCEDNAIFLR